MHHLPNLLTCSATVLLLVTAGCQKEPIASFTASSTTVDVGESVSFTNTSEEGVTFEWEFGDGGTSSAENPSYSYADPGTYTVALTALSKNGKKTDNASKVIKVNQPDPCENITCQNGGDCVNGTCICADGYTGADCSQQVTPTKVIITEILVTRFPATDGGAGWDLTSGPDIYVDVDQDPNSIWSSSIYFEDADPSNAYIFEPQPYIDINDVNSQVTLRLYDYDDFDGDDFMGGIIFNIYSSSDGFPTELTLDAGGDVAFTISLDYAW